MEEYRHQKSERWHTLLVAIKILYNTDTDNTLYDAGEGRGLQAITESFPDLGCKGDHKINAAGIVYDALYAYCQEMIRRGKPARALLSRWLWLSNIFFRNCTL